MAAVDLSPHVAPHGSGVIREGITNYSTLHSYCGESCLLSALTCETSTCLK
jgi:hypothetical protein